jgi:hypothetical protein
MIIGSVCLSVRLQALNDWPEETAEFNAKNWY